MKEKYFSIDGALRDIYCYDTTIEDWTRLIGDLYNQYEVTLSIDGEKTDNKTDPVEYFKSPREKAYSFTAEQKQVFFYTHFFSVRYIEFDIDPREIISEEHVKCVLDFMQHAGVLLKKDIFLTEENMDRKRAEIDYFIKWDTGRNGFIFK